MNRFRKRDRRQILTLSDMGSSQSIKHFRITQKRKLKGTNEPLNNGEHLRFFYAQDVDDVSL